MPEYRPRRVIPKLMTASMIADELGIPRSTATSLMQRIGWKYGPVYLKGCGGISSAGAISSTNSKTLETSSPLQSMLAAP
jgi:hypothetical protein